MKTITIPRMFDAHLHLRQGSILETVAPITAYYCQHALVMPNTSPPILNAADAGVYRDEILRATDGLDFSPLMTINIQDSTTPEIIEGAHNIGIPVGKIYPRGSTFNVENGLTDFTNSRTDKVLRKMEEVGMILSIHGEWGNETSPQSKWEKEFLPTLEDLADSYECRKRNTVANRH